CTHYLDRSDGGIRSDHALLRHCLGVAMVVADHPGATTRAPSTECWTQSARGLPLCAREPHHQGHPLYHSGDERSTLSVRPNGPYRGARCTARGCRVDGSATSG